MTPNQFFQTLFTAHYRHDDIEKDKVNFFLFSFIGFQCAFTIDNIEDDLAEFSQDWPSEVPDKRLVVDQKYGLGPSQQLFNRLT
jgi:hypothetical protein